MAGVSDNGTLAIRDAVEANYLDGANSDAIRELNRATAAAMKSVFKPHL